MWKPRRSKRPTLRDVGNRTWYIRGDRKCIVPITKSGLHTTPWGWGKDFRWRRMAFRDGPTGLEIVNEVGVVVGKDAKWHSESSFVVMVDNGHGTILFESLPAKIPPEARVCSPQNNIHPNDPFLNCPYL